MQGSRRFIDSLGFSWQVCEISEDGGSSFADLPHRGRGLYFFSRGTTLVLRSFPREWSAMTWPELEALRAGADVLGADSRVRLPATIAARRPGTELRA